jgi:UDP-glucose 4-epimerase
LGKRLLVTGGAGFIGSHVTERFLAQRYAVDIIDDLSTGKRDHLPADATLHVCDIRSPQAARIIRDGAFDVIVHLAAQMDVRKSVADPINDASINILGALNVAEALRHSTTAKSCRLVAASTGGVLYGDFVTPPNSESAPKDPESPYAIAKLSVELYLAYFSRVHGLDTVSLRYANVYGPRQDPHGEAGVVAIFCGRILDRKPLTIFGDGQQTRDYVYVGDVAEATYAAATRKLPPVERLDSRGFNIGTGVGTPVKEIARLLQQIAGVDAGVDYAPHRPGEQQHSFVAIDKAAAVLGWKPAVTFEEGLAKTYEWFAAKRGATARA